MKQIYSRREIIERGSIDVWSRYSYHREGLFEYDPVLVKSKETEMKMKTCVKTSWIKLKNNQKRQSEQGYKPQKNA